MESSLHIAEPVALARPRGAHRFEGFSPKLARRLTFYRRDLLEQWILFEADPAAIVFCERPGYVNVSGKQRLADFWVCFVDRQELVILDDAFYGVRFNTACEYQEIVLHLRIWRASTAAMT
jgi:hypothetical protein